jgi:hypothetical protein
MSFSSTVQNSVVIVQGFYLKVVQEKSRDNKPTCGKLSISSAKTNCEHENIEFLLKSFFQPAFICLHHAMLQKVHMY